MKTFGKWLTKLGAALVLIPSLLDTVEQWPLSPKARAAVQAIGAVLAIFGIRRGTADTEKQNALILEKQGVPVEEQKAAVADVVQKAKDAGVSSV